MSQGQLVRTASSERPVQDPRDDRWRQRPLLAGMLRAFVIAVPLCASVVVGVLVGRAFQPAGGGEILIWLALVLAASRSTLWAVDILARRLLPLQRLLLLCLVFPDRAPSRLRVAVRAARTRRPEAVLLNAETNPREALDGAGAAAQRIVTLLGALAVHDRRTRGHSERVCAYALLLGKRLRLSQPDLDGLMWAALIHDIGKLDVPAKVLNKPARPTQLEWRDLQEHPARGSEIAAPLADWLGPWFDAIGQHHERYDGTGYPAGLSGPDLCLGARIVAVADASRS